MAGGLAGELEARLGVQAFHQVVDLLRRYGITPDEPAAQQPGDQTEQPASIGT